METPRRYRAVKLSVCCFLHVLYNRTFLLGDCPSTTGNRSSLFFTALPTSLHQPGCQIVLSRWRRNLIAFSKIGTLGAVFFTFHSITQFKSSPDRKNGLLYIKIFRAMSCILMKVYWRRRKICSIRFQCSLLHQLIWRHIKIVVVCAYRCEWIKSQWTLFCAITTCLCHLTSPCEHCV